MVECFLKNLRYSCLVCIIIFGLMAIIGSSNGDNTPAGNLDERFTDMGDGTIKDNKSGLIWMKDATAMGLMNRSDAYTAAKTLAEGDFDWLSDGSSEGDWRLPTKARWEEFVDTSYLGPALCNTMGNSHWTQGDAFNNVSLSHFYWSGTYSNGHPWAMDMTVGQGTSDLEEDILYVWPVRSGSIFTDMGDGTVRDNESGLVWLKDAGALGGRTWSSLLDAVGSFNNGQITATDYGTGSYTDWRLPDVYELSRFIIRLSEPILSDSSPFVRIEVDAYYWAGPGYNQPQENYNCEVRLPYSGWMCGPEYALPGERYVWPVRSGN